MMSKTHFKKLTNPNYLGAYSIEDGQDLILTLQKIQNEMVMGADGKKEECVVAYFKEPNTKPMILNITNMKTISKIYGTPYIEDWANKQIKIGTEKVKAFGEVVEALRVRKVKPEQTKSNPIPCEICGTIISSAYGMTADQVAEYTAKKYGKKLCTTCAKEAAGAENEANKQ